MPALYAGKRVGKPLMGGHTYNALFNGKLVWPLDKDTVVSIEITDDKGNALPKSLAVNGSLKLGAKATYADGHVGDLLPTKGVTFTSRDTSTATVSGNTLTWRHVSRHRHCRRFHFRRRVHQRGLRTGKHQGHGRFRPAGRCSHPARRRDQASQHRGIARRRLAGVYFRHR